MGYIKINCIYSQRRRHNIIISSIVCFLFTFSFLISLSQGRKISVDTSLGTRNGEERAVRWRSMIGSRPPRCGEIIIRCGGGSPCARCEAVQVPVLPLKRSRESTALFFTNYKPMCWKCKCGDLIFDP